MSCRPDRIRVRMPNVLLFGGSKEMYEMLRAKAGWNVTRAVHDETTDREALGDPRRWHLRIDECEFDAQGTEETGIPPVPVAASYLYETTRCHSIMFASTNAPHLGVRTADPDGHQDLVFNPSGEPRAEMLEDFVDAFAADFTRGKLWSQNWGSATRPQRADVLFKDSYGQALAWIEAKALRIIEIRDHEKRVAAMEYLCRRSIPKIWPDVISDLFRPKRVVALEGERGRVIIQRRREVDEIEAAINAELEFFAPFMPLTELADDPLKDLVGEVFANVLGCEVTDLDQDVSQGEPKTLDLLLRRAGWTAFVEVRARGNRGARIDDIERLCAHAGAMEKEHGKPDSKVFVFNGLYWRGIESRSVSDVFASQVVEEAVSAGVSLLATPQLLNAIEALRNGETTDDAVVEALKMPGLYGAPV